ncbi:MAG: hypothetical protein ACXVQR_01785 [Solirubrobacteraceae bacterium]
MSVSSPELSPATAPAAVNGARRASLQSLWRPTGGRLYLILVLVALVIGALSLLLPSTPSYDPWAWIIWGREIVHLNLQTTGGPSWKPLPVIFTTLFAPFGKAAPDMWLVIARAGAVVAVAMSFKLAVRLTRVVAGIVPGASVADAARDSSAMVRLTAVAATLLAGAVTVVGVLSAGSIISDNALGYSEGLMAAAILIAIDRHLDGNRRQAFAVGFAAALDRPEVWPFWGLYGLYLWWTDAGARRLVAGLFVLTPLLWFLPELWGSGHLFRGVNRAQHPRSNSPAFASCPFCSELKDHAWKLLLLRLKVAAAAAMLASGFRIWRRRRAAGPGTPLASVLGVDGAILAIGGLGIAWMVLIALMTQAGFSGNNRYLILGAALINIVGGIGWGWSALELGALGRRLTGLKAAAPAVLAVLIALFLFFPSWIGSQVVDLPATHKALNYQARLRTDVALAVRRAGGPARVLRCGTVMTEGFQVPLVAWTLGVHTLAVAASPVSGPIRPPLPNVILRARANGSRRTAVLPPLPQDAGYRRIARTRTFSLYEKCK